MNRKTVRIIAIIMAVTFIIAILYAGIGVRF